MQKKIEIVLNDKFEIVATNRKPGSGETSIKIDKKIAGDVAQAKDRYKIEWSGHNPGEGTPKLKKRSASVIADKKAAKRLKMARRVKLDALKEERDRRTNTLAGDDLADKLQMIIHAIDLIFQRTEHLVDNNNPDLTPEQIAETKGLQSLKKAARLVDKAFNAAREWVKDEARTVEEIDNYDVVTDPNWPT